MSKLSDAARKDQALLKIGSIVKDIETYLDRDEVINVNEILDRLLGIKNLVRLETEN